MMTDLEYENSLSDIFRKELVVPAPVKAVIENFRYADVAAKKTVSIKRIVILATAALLTVGATSAYATGLLQVLFSSGNAGVNKALDYGYVQNVTGVTVTNEGVETKLESLVVDDSNIAIVLEHRLNEKTGKVEEIVLEGLLVEDENGTVYFEDGNPLSLSTGFKSKTATEDGILVKQALFFKSSKGEFPQAGEIKISFGKMVFFDGSQIAREYEGTWSFSVPVANQFSDGNRVSYIAEPNESLTVKSAEMTATGFQVTFEISYPLDAMGLKLSLTDDLEVSYPATSWSAENEGEKPLISTSFPLSAFEAERRYELVVLDMDSGKEMRVCVERTEE